MDYRVQYEIDVLDVESPLAAAQEAYENLRDPSSMAPVLDVTEVLDFSVVDGALFGNHTRVDLETEGEGEDDGSG